MVKIMENLIEIDDLGVFPLFSETSIYPPENIHDNARKPPCLQLENTSSLRAVLVVVVETSIWVLVGNSPPIDVSIYHHQPNFSQLSSNVRETSV